MMPMMLTPTLLSRVKSSRLMYTVLLSTESIIAIPHWTLFNNSGLELSYRRDKPGGRCYNSPASWRSGMLASPSSFYTQPEEIACHMSYLPAKIGIETPIHLASSIDTAKNCPRFKISQQVKELTKGPQKCFYY